MLEETLRLTVGDTIAHILPMGSMGLEGDEDPEDELTDDQDDRSSWRELPIWPTDLFVAVAHLVHVSGLLTYFDPDPDALFRPNDRPLCFTLTQKERVEAQAAGKQWATDSTPSQTVNRLWAKLVGAWEERIRASAHFQNARRRSVPTWWKAALQLVIIADEACIGLGAPPTSGYPERWLVEIFETIQAKPFAGDKKLSADAYQARRQRSSFGVDSDPDVACVQPKSRIASVGCSLRNLTKHVAYIPHVGNVRCHWHQPIGSDLPEDRDTLDILLIPLPLTIEDASFHPKAKADPDPSKRPRWGNFEIEQSWLRSADDPVEVVAAEISKAKRHLPGEYLNGIILPEYALTEPLFNRICQRAKEIAPELEFAVAGSSSNCEGETGNFVLTAIWKNNPLAELSANERRYLLTSRRKHHRWKLSATQISDYGLEKALSPDAAWWESHQIAQREVHFFHFRKTSVFTTMICEDLARSDPCHDILRSIGPNLLFALLMDGPQIEKRWPARYAATLADDPGTSVLTLTSVALVERSIRKYGGERVIAFWKDEAGNRKELTLADHSASLLLRLEAKRTEDQTLDGRPSENTWAWLFREAISL